MGLTLVRVSEHLQQIEAEYLACAPPKAACLEDAILNSPVVYSEDVVLAAFQKSCEAEAEEPGYHTERLKLNRNNRVVPAKKK